jgi:hypothetical protein
MKFVNRFSVLTVAALAMLLCACSGSEDSTSNSSTAVLEPERSENQDQPEFLFEIMYENGAWGYWLRGSYIDQEGNVYSYERQTERWNPADRNALTRDELLDKFNSSRKLIGQVEPEVLAEMAGLIRPAAKGIVEPNPSYCNDFGYIWYMAYQYDPDRELYLPVVLLLAGDAQAKNLSDDAQVLFDWLSGVDSRFDSPDCMP